MEKKKKAPANQKPDDHTVASEEKAEMSAKESKALEKANTEHVYQITCCNPVSGSFGGVTFKEGVAYTKDGFTASWFRNKEGYIVSAEKGTGF
ncbi:MAG: hypothetical protein HFI51_07980 [Lachnospiraceae bacterium]|nr:hypothetical protein [Lachnospiraceae bacterium]